MNLKTLMELKSVCELNDIPLPGLVLRQSEASKIFKLVPVSDKPQLIGRIVGFDVYVVADNADSPGWKIYELDTTKLLEKENKK